MAKISTFIYAESAMQEMTPQGPKLHIVSPLLIIRPIFVPGTFSFSIIFGILDYDIKVNHKVHILFTDENEERLVDSGIMNVSAANSNNKGNIKELPRDMEGSIMNMSLQNVIFRKEGTYKTHVIFDDEEIGSYPIKVKGVEKT